MNVSIFLKQIDFPDGQTLLSPPVMCGPSGKSFKKPVIVGMRHCASLMQGPWVISVLSCDMPVGAKPKWKVQYTLYGWARSTALTQFIFFSSENLNARGGNHQHLRVRANGRGTRVLDERNPIQVCIGWRTGPDGSQQSTSQNTEIGLVRVVKSKVQVRYPGARG